MQLGGEIESQKLYIIELNVKKGIFSPTWSRLEQSWNEDFKKLRHNFLLQSYFKMIHPYIEDKRLTKAIKQ